MAKHTRSSASNSREFAEQSRDQAMQAANFGANWFREIAEQGLSQAGAVLDGYLAISKKAIDSVDQQAIAVNKSSLC
jgi:hypothetical protein